jgi:hypothetical protein
VAGVFCASRSAVLPGLKLTRPRMLARAATRVLILGIGLSKFATEKIRILTGPARTALLYRLPERVSRNKGIWTGPDNVD